MKIGIFCSANSAIAPEYFEKTEALGTWIAGEGHAIVFGGCNLGLMECIARAVHQGGGTTIGVVPTIIGATMWMYTSPATTSATAKT